LPFAQGDDLAHHLGVVAAALGLGHQLLLLLGHVLLLGLQLLEAFDELAQLVCGDSVGVVRVGHGVLPAFLGVEARVIACPGGGVQARRWGSCRLRRGRRRASDGKGSAGRGSKMQALVWAGALVSLCGIAGLVYCVMRALRARRSGLPDEAMRTELQRVVVVNMGALAVSALGLMLVVLGIFL